MSSQVAFGLGLALLISSGAAAVGALTGRAAFASTVVGTLVFAAGGVAWSIPLLTFFITSSLLSKHRRSITPGLATRDTPRRTAKQVMANGLVPALWAACHLLFPGDAWTVLFAAALATAAADTWATEIGRHSSNAPRDVLTGRRIPKGSSGGISPRGLAASLAGSTAVTIACVATGLIGPVGATAVAMAGFGGSLVDSVLGSAIQERRWCSTCGAETEDKLHPPCSTSTSYLRGLAGFDNDWVNFSAGACGSLLGLVFTYLF